jgi:NADH-quinone oxidoreductase subunit K
MNIPTDYILALSGVLFVIGVLGVLVRRNAIVIFMSIELMLNSANLALIAFARAMAPAAEALRGHVLVFFVIAVAAAELQNQAQHRRRSGEQPPRLISVTEGVDVL